MRSREVLYRALLGGVASGATTFLLLCAASLAATHWIGGPGLQ